MNSSILKLTIREIKNSLGRYVAIFAIIALGAGLFMGLRMSKPDFIESYDRYAREYNFYDYRLVSTLGLTQEDLDEVLKIDGVISAEGVATADFLFNSADGENLIMVAQTIPEKMNLINLREGRMPKKGNECLADPELYSKEDIGRVIKLSEDNSKQTADTFAYDEYTIVGLADSVLYINYERGSSTLGNGSVEGYIYLSPEGFSADCFTDIYLSVRNDGYIYSDEYSEQTSRYEKQLKELMEKRAVIRRDDIIVAAEAELKDAKAQYEAGMAQYEPAKSEYEKGAKEFAERKKAATEELDSAEAMLRQADELIKNPSQLEEKQAELNAAREELDKARTEYETGLRQFEAQKTLKYLSVNGKINYYTETVNEKKNDIARYTAELDELNVRLSEAGRFEAVTLRTRISVLDALIKDAEGELNTAQKQLEKALADKAETDAELAPYEKQLNDAKIKLDEGYAQINAGQAELDAAKELVKDSSAIQKRWDEYRAGRAEAERSFAAAEKEIMAGKAELDKVGAELDNAKTQLNDAEKQIKNIEHADTYVLGRDTNIGYMCFDSDTQIVQSVAGVFPVFFFLVAALVCLTTMTRMIDDERTQVGIMKALGYNSWSVMLKYLLYSGSATLLGCIFGIAAGSVIFPALIWFGYGLLYNIEGLSFTMNWPLALGVTAANLVLMLAVTWYCCKRELKSAAAELIRPKAPEAGKRIFLEKIQLIWNRLSFMQKVSARNILRYKKRLFMIVLGVGGCTALVLTAFGLNDTIKTIVREQYEDIFLYDYEMSLAYNMTEHEREIFLEECGDNVSGIMFMYRSTAQVKHGDISKSATITATDETDISEFISLCDGKKAVAYPGENEAVINVNLAEMLGVKVGDEIEISTADMDTLKVKVAALTDSYVGHNVYVTLKTCTEQWGFCPELKSALACAPDGSDVYETSEKLSEADGVRSISLCADSKARIENMLGGLNFIIAAIIVCAGLLAFIVLYNLTNINISERIREIATIKVLGFYRKEAADYVFRENTVLTGLGAMFGLILGVVFHAFVMKCIKVDMLYFEPHINFISFVISIALTFVFSMIVNSIMRRKIDNIDMAGALKSIE